MTHQKKQSEQDELSTPIDDHLYKLVNREPVPCSFVDYVQSMQNESQRIVAQSHIEKFLVSTIFTGIDHSFGTGKKALYETMIFGLPDEFHPKWQYSTWDEAEKAHNELIESLSKNGIDSLINDIKNRIEE